MTNQNSILTSRVLFFIPKTKKDMSKKKEKIKLHEKLATLPSHTLSERQLYDLEMILSGGFSPLKGFVGKEDYHSILDNVRLANGSLWPIPITLDTNTKYQIGQELILVDEYKTPIGILEVSSIYEPNIQKESLSVYGTLDIKHPGISYLINQTKKYYVGGTVTKINNVEHLDFIEIRKTPIQLHNHLKKKSIIDSPIIAFQTRNPIHRAHFELIQRSAKKVGAHILIHPVVGPTKEGDIDYITRVRGYKKLVEAQDPTTVTLSLLPLAMRMAGPREALWHALIRKNYGATHFIIGRDHAGPGNDSSGKPFYGAYAAQDFVQKYSSEIGIVPVFSEELVYIQESNSYKEVNEVLPEETVLSISGTRFREMIRKQEEVPEWFAFKEVIDEIKKTNNRKGIAILFTGLSGAGKSTLARHVKTKIEHCLERSISFFDGDIIRSHLTEGLGFSKEDRIKNVARVGFVASEIIKHGGIVLASLVSPYHEARKKFKEQVEKYGTYIEIHVHAPQKVLSERDVKGYYKKQSLGLMKGLTGVDDVYEVPQDATLSIDTSNKGTLAQSVNDVVNEIQKVLA
ncbi:MAG: bifunctional sulfate adenylyltransferase/adenylylsulfate kinase [bacterium]